MSSPARRPPPAASPTKQPAPASPSRAAAAGASTSPPKSPTRTTAIRPVPMDVDRESLRKKRAASPDRNDADDESEKSPSKSSSTAGDGVSSSIDDRPTKRLHGDSSVSGSTSVASSKPASSSSSPTKRSLSPAKSPKLTAAAVAPVAKPAAFTGFGALSSTPAAPSAFSGFGALGNKPSVFGASSTTSSTSTTSRLTSSFGGGFGGFSTSSASSGGFSALAATAPTTSIFASASSASFNKGTDSARDAEDDNDDGNDDDAQGADAEPAVHFQPIVHLEQQHVVTGEEDEKTVATERAKLFLPDADGNPKERGIGSVKVNVRTLANGERRARVLMRAEGVHNVLVNAPLLPGMSCNVSERVLQFGALVDGKLVIHLFRFKTAVPCGVIADAIRANVPAAPANGEGANGDESGSGEDHEDDDDEQHQGDEAV